ncbi:MAG: zf-HC2 domain-containing protein [Bacteroidetes bacterium]|nr:zf-HC2 domain-containing protein [Bacteroidota bacterium]
MKQTHVNTNLPAFLEGTLDEKTRLAVQNHLNTCPECQEEARFLQEVFRSPAPESLHFLEPDSDLADRILTGTLTKGKNTGYLRSLFLTTGLSAAAVVTGILVGNWFFTVSNSSVRYNQYSNLTVSSEAGTDLETVLQSLAGEQSEN